MQQAARKVLLEAGNPAFLSVHGATHLVNPAGGDLEGRWRACHACVLCTCWWLLAASSQAL